MENSSPNVDITKIETKNKFQAKNNSESNSEDLDIDLKQVWANLKRFYRKLASADSSNSDNSASDELNIKPAIDFIKKNPSLCILLLLLILQFVPNAGFLPWGGIWMRSMTQDLPFFDDLARQSVENQLRNQINSQINAKYPNLPSDQRNKLLNEEFERIFDQQKEQIDDSSKDIARQFKDQYHYDVNGGAYTYMPDIDPYTFLRRARNILDHGYPGDVKKDSVDFDNHMIAPLGTIVENTFHHYTLFYLHKIFSLFSPRIPLMQSAAFFPLIFSLLSMIPAFFIAKKLGGNIAGILASSFLIIDASFLTRTLWGHADTDAYNVFFPLYIFWFFFLMIQSDDLKKKSLFAVVAGFLIGLYSYVWAWWYIFDFIVAALGLHLTGLFILRRSDENVFEHVKKLLVNGLLISFTTFIFVGIFSDFEFTTFFKGFIAPFSFTIIKNAAHSDLWPNVYTTVAELSPLDISGILSKFGTNILLICFLGVLSLFLRGIKKKEHMIYSFVLIIWFFATVYATTKGIRFSMLIIPPLAISFGTAFGVFANLSEGYVKKWFNIKSLTINILVILIGAFFVSSLVPQSYAVSRGDIPMVNDAWWSILGIINQESEPDAIITSWWDFGHHFKFIADRAVTFDGASQNSPMAHWVGRILATDNESEAVGILRMLNCGSNRAFEELNKQSNNTIKTINTLYNIFNLDKEQARIELEKNFTGVDRIIQYTHCDPPESYFITSQDMVGKAPVWAHFGLWDFEKARAWIEAKYLNRNKVIDWAKTELGYDDQKADKLYRDLQSISTEDQANQWIAQWPAYDQGSFADCDVKAEGTFCGNNLRITFNETYIEFNGVHVSPKELIYINHEKNLTVKRFITSNTAFSAVLIPQRQGYKSFYAWPELADSMFTRLHFMEGHGLKYFKHVATTTQIVGGVIHLWKVDWNGTQQNILDGVKERTTVEPDSIIVINQISWKEDGEIIASTIKDWLNKNITKEVDFDLFETNPETITLNGENEINIVAGQLIGLQKGEEKIISISPETLKSMNSPPVFGNNTITFRIKIEDIN